MENMASLHLFCFFLSFTSLVHGCCENSLRLYDVNADNETDSMSEGAVQYCYGGTWYGVCDYSWYCQEANVACRQLGFLGAHTYVRNSGNSYGYYSPIRHYYYSCNGHESSLSDCNSHYLNSYYCRSSDAAGVRCVDLPSNTTNDTVVSCSVPGSVQLSGGKLESEGVLNYCSNGYWVQFCALDEEEAVVACKQLGYQPFAALISVAELDSWNEGYSPLAVSCNRYATETNLSNCSFSSTYTNNYYYSSVCTETCTHPKAIRCYRGDLCVDGKVRLVDGSLNQEGRVEVCVNGVWGSICGQGWSTSDARVVCKQLGYPDTEPYISTNGKYGAGNGPIFFSGVSCQGWENSFSLCGKTSYRHFTCSHNHLAGTLCTDGCTEGEVRLVGGSSDSEGTVEICHDKLWGLITDAGWDNKDARVICKQLNLPVEGSVAIKSSWFGKPDRAIHYSYSLCHGDELSFSSCWKVTHSLSEGRNIYKDSQSAGVICLSFPPSSSIISSNIVCTVTINYINSSSTTTTRVSSSRIRPSSSSVLTSRVSSSCIVSSSSSSIFSTTINSVSSTTTSVLFAVSSEFFYSTVKSPTSSRMSFHNSVSAIINSVSSSSGGDSASSTSYTFSVSSMMTSSSSVQTSAQLTVGSNAQNNSQVFGSIGVVIVVLLAVLIILVSVIGCAVVAWCVRTNIKKERSTNRSLPVMQIPSSQYQMLVNQSTDADPKDSSDEEFPGT
ncbi:PREDICTED: scavenger receptor cysteine-rich type 1 protein M130-like isoform X2 [Amphimedon queenslandica]|uniref:SRCR domain-containing protein n=1 Tax=Amphimedon queenslandica TaxID=400682 RepID=A0AAN0JBT9_AMPQE|nr:PREDICTED: scavenger receptor cysteine-rich type 1 protein M130-like isoform X2 [Amphimedon queenslandica]|eukprot:XP_019854464.1 PREDICTED: scavenger receptor cysteine-rich type 1 protein M130-like isoform X2 [Amphimedon queenslandica]